MQSIYTPNLILPESVTSDEKIRALVEALNEQLKLLSASAEQTLHLPRLDKLTGEVLDLLAWQFHLDFYDGSILTDKKKRNLIRNSIDVHRRYGTRYAVMQVLKEFFDTPTLQEVGNFYFRIKSRGFSGTPDEEKMFWQMLNHSKNVRSWLAGMDFDFSPEEPTTIRVGSAIAAAGVMNVEPARLADQKTTLYAGNALYVDGNVEIAPYAPPSYNKVIVHAGCPMIIVGNITIKNADEPTLHPTKENPHADLLIANIGIPR